MKHLFKKKTVLFALFLSSVFIGQSQTSSGSIYSELQFSNLFVYVVESNNEYYKTTASTEDYFDEGDAVTIEGISNSDLYRIITVSSIAEIFAKKITTNTQNPMLGGELLLSAPEEINSMLFFTDFDHLENFKEVLLLNEGGAAVGQEIFEEFENLYGSFRSFQTKIDNKYPEEFEFTEDDLDRYSLEDHILDEALVWLFNENKLIGIGESVYYYHNTGEIMEMDASIQSDIDLVIQFSQLDKNTVDLFNSEYGFYKHENYGITSDFKHGVSTIKDAIGYVFDHGIFNYASFPIVVIPPANCVNNRQGLYVEVDKTYDYGYNPNTGQIESGFYQLDLSGYVNTLTIDWGDGSPLEVIQSYDGSVIYHTFATEGTFFGSTVLDFIDPELGSGIITSLIDTSGMNFVINGNCTAEDRTIHTDATSGNWTLKTKLWTKHNVFGKQIGSWSHAFKKVNGKWKRRRANISTSVQGTFRGDVCQVEEVKNGSKSQNSRRVRKTKNKLFAKYGKFTVGNGEITSSHSLSKDGTTININNEIIACP